MVWGHFSYDIDDEHNEYCAKTDICSDETAHRHKGTDGNFGKGHRHRVYRSVDDYVGDSDPTFARPADDPASIGRTWDECH